MHFLSVLEDFDLVTPQQYIMPSGCFQSSERITAPLVTLIICQYGNEVIDYDSVRTVKNEVRRVKRHRQDEQAELVNTKLTSELKRCVRLSKEKGLLRGYLSSRLRNMGSIYRKENLEMYYVLDTCGN